VRLGTPGFCWLSTLRLKVFLSHDHRESPIAEAWQLLLCAVSDGVISAWYSSDPRPDGGTSVGEWYAQLQRRIADSDAVLALLTAESCDRPWILWECATARAARRKRPVIPVTFDLAAERVRGPLAGLQVFRGDAESDVAKLCAILCRTAKVACTDAALAGHIAHYRPAIQQILAARPLAKLFAKGFHKPDASLSGRWYSTWYRADGTVFEKDELDLYMSDDGIRIVGFGAKGHMYPMEGRLSPDRVMALQYWSEQPISVLGTVLLRVAASGRSMAGYWVGHTATNLDDELQVMHGTAAWSRDACPA
jgi:hypothetical protein